MDSTVSSAPRAILFGLDPAIEAELSASLRDASYVVSRSATLPGARKRASGEGGIVFCPRGAAFSAAKTAFPHLPVVIVSRLPDTREWLDALESGASDYVAAPFESIQMRWLLTNLGTPPQSMPVSSAQQNRPMPKCA